MRSAELREARARAALTQAQLAHEIGVSQSAISSFEQGTRRIPPAVESKLRHVLGKHLEEVRSIEPNEVAFSSLSPWAPSQPKLPLPLRLRSWERQQPSGDVLRCLPLFGDAVLVMAIDVAGHGAEAMGPANYLMGWLAGWVHGLATTPRVESCARALGAVLSNSGLEASWFLALLIDVHPHEVEYTATSYGFPPPLLLLNDTDITLESTAKGRVVRHQLRAPWKLILASDGLLERLGEGDETKGKRALVRWQASKIRDEPLDKRLGSVEPPADDETLLILEWCDWDLDLEFDNRRPSDRKAIEAAIASWLSPRIDQISGQWLANMLVEALDNVDEHAYGRGPGKVCVRVRDEGGRVRIEVEDRGTWRGERILEGCGFKVMRTAASAVETWRIYPQGMKITFVRERSDT